MLNHDILPLTRMLQGFILLLGVHGEDTASDFRRMQRERSGQARQSAVAKAITTLADWRQVWRSFQRILVLPLGQIACFSSQSMWKCK